ncbi:hypothetical protein ISCGN_003541 [Ixodes scapularis]
MSSLWRQHSSERVFCADYLAKHKKKIPMQRNFRSVRELDVDCLKRILPSGSSMEVSKLDYLCYNCFTHFTNQISLRSSELGGDSFMPPEEAIEDLNRSERSTFVSPLRPPSEVRSRDRPAYVKRKQT